MIGAGGQAGQGDAANLLKPALARGELRTIAATTWAEYKKYFEKDAALARRFQVVKVEEPAETQAHRHDARPRRDAREAPQGPHPRRGGRGRGQALAPLHLRPPAARQGGQPARHRLRPRRARPERHPARRRGRDAVGSSTSRSRSASSSARAVTGARHDERLAETVEAAPEGRGEARRAEEALGRRAARSSSRSATSATSSSGTTPRQGRADGRSAGRRRRPPPEVETLKADLEARTDELRRLQGEDPLVQVCVDAQTVAEVVSGWTGIPVGKMVPDEIQTVLTSKRSWKSASSASRTPSRRSPSASAPPGPDLADPRRPIGVFLLVGPSGVGKTETALALAETLYGGDRNMIIDQHVGVPGGAHGLAPQGLAAGLRRLRRRAAC